MLWIALHLPRLSLEAFTATVAGEKGGSPSEAAIAVPIAAPIALIDEHRISAANAAAQSLGVKPGLKRATALALAPQLMLGQADAVRDARALQPVTHAALAFTPQVSLQPATEPGRAADTVLLEVQASLRYFGGHQRLLQRLHDALRPLGHRVQAASAVTAQAAAVLARVEPPPHCADAASTRQAFEAAPVWLLGPGREHWEALQGMGLRCIVDLLALPRAGLARRFGEAMLAEIDAALGRRPDPREPIVLSPAFESRLELFARADTTEQVLHGAAVLLERLVAWLTAQHAQVRCFRLVMRHESRWQQGDRGAQASALEIALAEPSRDSAHLLMLLRERLARLQLPAPTLELCLQAEDIVRRAVPNSELFPTARSENEGLTRLIERLQARLGNEQVQRLAVVADHRPERASRLQAADAGVAVRVAGTCRDAGIAGPALRPVWLQPIEALAEQRSMPMFESRPLKLLSGPERIEAGWWDSALAGRDYFIAEAADGALIWIYRERLPVLPAAGAVAGGGSGWFVQGRFG